MLLESIHQRYLSIFFCFFFIKYVYKPNMILVYSLKEYFLLSFIMQIDGQTNRPTPVTNPYIVHMNHIDVLIDIKVFILWIIYGNDNRK